ncbi:hypothetical protein H632_c778p0 [Helicosporidium sp. ATCC 50920]|nr:hypothetical protein H632_c778p0 [Helicosporidium sp. ATCC 50920]|eukprot:KDD75263.1 hypothetical protein H632_c778p0 [Helicosporidium sp. ATCC 50920]
MIRSRELSCRGAGLSLTKLAAGRASTYDPRRVRAAELQRGATVVGAYRKLKRKTEGQRPAPRLSVEDAAREQEALLAEERARRRSKTNAKSEASTSDEAALHVDSEGHLDGRPGPASQRRKAYRLADVAARIEDERAEAQREHEAQRAEAEARRKELEERRGARREQTRKLMRVRTCKGQPVMKHGIEKLLGQIQASQR